MSDPSSQLSQDGWSCVAQFLTTQEAIQLSKTAHRLQAVASRRASYRPFRLQQTDTDTALGEDKVFDIIEYERWNQLRETVTMTPIDFIRMSHSRVMQHTQDIEFILPSGSPLRTSSATNIVDQYIPPYTHEEMFAAIERYHSIRAIRFIVTVDTDNAYVWNDHVNIRTNTNAASNEVVNYLEESKKGFVSSSVFITALMARWVKSLIAFEIVADGLAFTAEPSNTLFNCLSQLKGVRYVSIRTRVIRQWLPYVRKINFPPGGVLRLDGALHPNPGSSKIMIAPDLIDPTLDIFAHESPSSLETTVTPPTHVLFDNSDLRDLSISPAFDLAGRALTFRSQIPPLFSLSHLSPNDAFVISHTAFGARLQHFINSHVNGSVKPANLQSLTFHFSGPASLPPMDQRIDMGPVWRLLCENLRRLTIFSSDIPTFSASSSEFRKLPPSHALLATILGPSSSCSELTKFTFPRLDTLSYRITRSSDELPTCPFLDLMTSQRLRIAFPDLRTLHIWGMSVAAQSCFSGVFFQLKELGLSLPPHTDYRAFTHLFERVIRELRQLTKFVLDALAMKSGDIFMLPSILMPVLLSSNQLREIDLLLNVHYFIDADVLRKQQRQRYLEPILALHQLWLKLQPSHLIPPYRPPTQLEPIADLACLLSPLLTLRDRHHYRTSLAHLPHRSHWYEGRDEFDETEDTHMQRIEAEIRFEKKMAAILEKVPTGESLQPTPPRLFQFQFKRNPNDHTG